MLISADFSFFFESWFILVSFYFNNCWAVACLVVVFRVSSILFYALLFGVFRAYAVSGLYSDVQVPVL